MAPVKYDDLPKASNEVLNDDYQTSGYLLKAKQKTNWDGAVVTTAIDLFPGKDPVQTPAKITFKLPKPFGINGLSVEKLEVDKAGKFKFEAVADKGLHKVPDLKLEAKSDLVDLAKATAGFTYTGVANTLVKFETRTAAPQFFTLEVTQEIQNATVGVKLTGVTNQEVGLRIDNGGVTAALIAKEKLSVFTAHGFFKANNDLKLAASYEHGGKKSGSLSAGLAYTVKEGTLLKAKVQQDGVVSASVKHTVSKGFTVIAGGKFDAQNGKHTYGLQLSVE